MERARRQVNESRSIMMQQQQQQQKQQQQQRKGVRQTNALFSEPKIHDTPSVGSKQQRQWLSCFRQVCKSCSALSGQFRQGVSTLCHDVRVAWRYRRLTRLERRRRLARKDLLACQRAFGDLLRVLPIMVNPLPPPFGLSLIALAYRWPRWMLPPQFHSNEQREQFAKLDAARQAYAAFELLHSQQFVQIFQSLCDPSLGLFSPETPLNLPNNDDTMHSKKEQLNRFITQFMSSDCCHVTNKKKKKYFALEGLHRRDLVRCVNLAQPRLPVSACCDPFTLRAIVRRKAADIDDDDALLLIHGSDSESIIQTINAMPRTDLIDACIARALGGVDTDDSPTPQHRLAAWLQRRVLINTAWPNKAHLPPTFIFFLALLHFDSFEHHPTSASPSATSSFTQDFPAACTSMMNPNHPRTSSPIGTPKQLASAPLMNHQQGHHTQANTCGASKSTRVPPTFPSKSQVHSSPAAIPPPQLPKPPHH